MILTDEEIQSIRRSIEMQAGLDPELLQRCGHLIHIGAFDEAVRNAFVLLEERLRAMANKEGMTGTQLANYAFSQDGSLAKQLASSPAEKEGLRELYSGAFKLFRNPTAHGVVGYDSADGKSIIGLVNLLLRFLARASDPSTANLIPQNLRGVLVELESNLGANPSNRLQAFALKCIKAGVRPQASPKINIPFRKHALVKYEHWRKPKPYPVPIFYLTNKKKEYGLRFPVNRFYSNIVGLDTTWFKQDLKSLGFQAAGRQQNLVINLLVRNDQLFFDKLFDTVMRLCDEIEKRLQKG
jgi:uncharacterized protein (TIGR02391 family)